MAIGTRRLSEEETFAFAWIARNSNRDTNALQGSQVTN
jgi:hypothetical protein